MYFTKKKYFATQYAIATAWFCLALLTACSDDNHKKVSGSSSSVATSSSSSSHSSSSGSSLTNSPEVGQWYAPAYGYVLSVSVENNLYKVKTYSVSKSYCLLQDVASNLPLDELKREYVYSNPMKETLLESKGEYPPGIEYEKVEQLPKACDENLQKVKADTGYTFDAKKDFEIFWQAFDELYINFSLRGMIWSEVYEDAIKSVDKIKSEEELFEFLSTLIAPLGDGHAQLMMAPLTQDLDQSITAAFESDETTFFGASTQLTLYQKLTNEYIQNLEPEKELTAAQMEAVNDYFLNNYLKIFDIIFDYADENFNIKESAAGEIVWFKTNENIGYLIIGSMADYTEGKSTIISDIASDVAIAEAAISEALKDLEDTEGLIIDVRFNGGGDDRVALTFVRHFMNQSQVVYSKSAGRGAWATPKKEVVLDPQTDNLYLKPTAVLVSGDTASAAELFTIAMGSLPHVTIIGEPTAGEFSDILVKRLTSDILFGVSNETYLDVQGNNYEGIGIPADIAVPFATLQERNGGYDSGLNTAIDWIKSAP
ncbi:MAG: S41 family peptidase [Pseudomonadota bacterium]